MKKNVSKSKPKFLHCFRPVDVDMVFETKAVRRRQVRTVENKEDKKAALVTKTMSLDRGFSSPADSENSKMPPRPSRTFSKAVKAVVFETILAKKARDRKVCRQDSFGSKRCFSLRSEASLNLGGDESVKKFEETKPISEMSLHSRSSSSSSSALSSSSSVSESKRLSKTFSDPTKQSLRNPQNPAAKPKNTEVVCSGFNSGTYFLLISLAVTVFWGKAIAILVSSIWLYFFPWRSSCKISPENVRRWSDAECRDNNKRVIMEGLIERKNHLHHHHQQGERRQ
ncbi:uncharacterized protein LOC103933492 [Pyrus x bretschneideri]|uniref:uncharacterized protein LOC103933492 n=1 Tax=Pyrus x bretschneideri TaxID=225117 RepID=UPI000510D029|nr:uncharacterized protein LOC103933492 [Pyrus x bretschneideri]